MHRWVITIAIVMALSAPLGVQADVPLFSAAQAPRQSVIGSSYSFGPSTVAIESAEPELYPIQMAVPQSQPCLPEECVNYGYPGMVAPGHSCDPPYFNLAEEWHDLCTFPERGPAPCDECPRYGIYAYHSYGSWRGVSEGSGGNNNGFLYGANLGTRLGAFSDYTGIGAQIGGTYGLYDLNGRASGFNDNQLQQQFFTTVGLFRKADNYTNWSGGVVWDSMINTNFGQFSVSPFLSQIRVQLAWAYNERHEFGVWSALRMSGDREEKQGVGLLAFRGVDQFNFFWHHRFAFGGDGWTWIGFPDFTKLGGPGSLGEYIFGGTLVAPLSPRLAAFTDLQYMRPSAAIGTMASMEETFFVQVGIAFYPGRNARADNVAGDCWMPYMPVANNGTFIVDTNRTF